jgi:signal peptidase I
MENSSQNQNPEKKVERKRLRYYIGKLYHFSTTWTGALVIVLFTIFFIAQSFVIPSGSMIKTLLIQDYLFVKKFSYGVPTPHLPWLEIPLIPGVGLKLVDGDKPKRGDIVVFRKPGEESNHFVKRCVAVEGDMVMVINKELYLRPNEGDLYILENYPQDRIIDIKGTLWVRSPYIDKFKGIWHDKTVVNDGSQPQELFYFKPTRVSENNYFMMGDNRDHSSDSRFWGSVPYENIEGTPWMVYFSMDDNYTIRWDRMFKSIEELEEMMR